MQGKPLQNTWRKDDGSRRKMFFYEHRFEHPGLPKSEALVSLDYKYIHYYEFQDSCREFYDLRTDRGEINNLINSEEYQSLIDNYSDLLDSLRAVVR